MVNQLFTATFSNAQATCDNLSDFHPKRLKYDIIQVNNYISSAGMTLKAALSAGGTITDLEILYFQFKVYKKIKAPAKWTTLILVLESTVASTPGYTPETLFNEIQAKYTKPVESVTVAAFRQDYGGTNLGHGCSTAASQEKFQQFNKVQAQLRAKFRNNGKRQEESSFCQFTW